MSHPPLLQRIRERERLTVSEAKIADLFERDYPLTALETVTSISEKAGVGKATVVRFISRLGYKSFADFQEQLREELVSRLESPFRRYSVRKLQQNQTGIDYLGQYITHAQKNMSEVHSRIDPEQIMEAARLMAHCEGSIYVQGQWDSHSLGHLFWVQVMYLRDRVYLLENLNSALPHQLTSVSDKDVLLLISRHRFTYQTHQVARWFSRQGAKVILITDRELNPNTELADIQIVVRSDGLSLFNSNCARLAVIESLIWAMTHLLEDNINQRAEICEALWGAFSTFLPWVDGAPARKAAGTQAADLLEGLPGGSLEGKKAD